jgi:hypothetical protein
MTPALKAPKPSKLPAVGWREYVALPKLGIDRIKAKVDTGARTSALHAINILYITRQGATHVRFEVHPKQRSTKRLVHCEAPLLEERYVTDSGGKRTLRPVILTQVAIAGKTVDVELTLVSRDEMGFRMLIGRQALRNSFVVDSGRSYLGGGKKKKKSPKSPKFRASSPKKAKP